MIHYFEKTLPVSLRAFMTGVYWAVGRSMSSSHTITPDEVRKVFSNFYPAPWDQSRHYFEAHVTIEPSETMTFDEFRGRVSSDETVSDWRVSSFSEDDVDNIVGKWFMTSRSNSLTEIKKMVSRAITFGDINNLVISRWKVEDTLLDSARGDQTSELTKTAGA